MKNHNTDSLEIQIVACCYRMSPVQMARKITKILTHLKIKHRGVIFSSRVDVEEQIDCRWYTCPAPNNDLDFSSYFLGASQLHESGYKGVVLFVNDTLFENHSANANIAALTRLVSITNELPVPVIAGKCDSYSTICLRNPWSNLSKYVSTYCFLLNNLALNHLIDLKQHAATDCVLSDIEMSNPEWGKGLELSFREFIKANLIYRSSPYLWYRLRKQNFDLTILQSKARAIYFEHRLSGLVGRYGCILPSNSGLRWSVYLKFREILSRIFI
jgi:hypothetical protein